MAKRVLLVDDSETALLLERMVLGRGSYEIVVARNGREAVEKAEALRPDAIVMDVMMPEMSGIEACSRIKSNQDLCKIPVILVTTRGEVENVERGFASGCNEYVTKPVDAMELLTKLEGLLDRAEPQA